MHEQGLVEKAKVHGVKESHVFESREGSTSVIKGAIDLRKKQHHTPRAASKGPQSANLVFKVRRLSLLIQ